MKKENRSCKISVTGDVWKELTYIKWDGEYDSINEVIQDLLKDYKKGDRGE